MEQEHRYERKFYITDLNKSELMLAIKLNKASFSEIYHKRQINNIYFDSPGFDSYFDNVDGAFYRVKARIRWYGETFGQTNDPTLEFKIKKGLMGYKRNYKLARFSVNKEISRSTLLSIMLDAVKDEKLRAYLHSLYPVLLNVYTRQYFISFDRTVRLTVDEDLHFYKISTVGNTFFSPIRDDKGLVVELKYDKKDQIGVERIASEFPFLMTKNSKYLQGLARIWGLNT